MIILLLAAVTDVDYPRPPVISPLRPSQMTGPFRYGFSSKDAGASARLLLTVDPNGKIINCDVTVPSGHPKLDTAGCKLYLGVKGQPALGGDGKPAYGTVSAGVTFFKDGGLIPLSVDLQLVVDHLPDQNTTFTTRASSLIVDPSGKVLKCRNMLYGRVSTDALDRTLCKVAATSVTFKPVLDVAGRPVESVQAFAVEFSTKDAPLVRPGPSLPPE